MQFISLAEFKAHARIGDTEDDVAQLKVDAANDYLSRFTAFEEADEPPRDLKQAALLIASHWWENREDTTAERLTDIPLDASEILLNHRTWAF